MTTARRPDRSADLELDASAARDRGRPAGLPRRPRAARQHRLRDLHARRRRRGRPLDGAGFLEARRRHRHPAGPDGRFGEHGRRDVRGQARARASLLIGHMDTVFDPGTAAERPFRIDDDVAHGPGVTDMKSGLLAGLYAIKAIIAEVGGLPFERLTFIANPDEEIGSPSSTPAHPGGGRGRRRRAWSSSAPAPTATSCRRKGILDTPPDGPRPGRPRRGRAGEGPQRDPRGGAPRPRPPRPQRPLAGRDRQRRDRSAARRPNVVAERCDLEVDVRVDDRPTASRRPRRPSARSPQRPRCPTRPSTSTSAWNGGRWRSSSGRAARRPREGDRRAARVRGQRRGHRWRVRRQHDVRDGRADARRPRPDRRQRPLARRSTSRSNRSCRGRRCWPGCCSRSRATRGPRLARGRSAVRRGDRRRRRVGGSRRAARGRRSPATAGRSSSGTRAGSPARPMPARTASRSTRATSPARRARCSGSSSAP